MGMRSTVATNHGRMVTQPTAYFFGRRFESSPVNCHRRRRRHVRPTRVPNRQQKSLQSAALLFSHCLFWDNLSSPLVEGESATDKNPKLCVSVSPDINTTTAPPPPLTMEVQLYLPPSMTFFKAPSREPRRGGGPGKGLQRPPARASQFSPTPSLLPFKYSLKRQQCGSCSYRRLADSR